MQDKLRTIQDWLDEAESSLLDIKDEGLNPMSYSDQIYLEGTVDVLNSVVNLLEARG